MLPRLRPDPAAGVLPAGEVPGSGSFALHGSMVDVLSGGRGPGDELALQYSRARYFDLKHGRFLQRDPKGYIDGANLYEAFRGNPARFTDPMGQWVAEKPIRIREDGKIRLYYHVYADLSWSEQFWVWLCWDHKTPVDQLHGPLIATVSFWETDDCYQSAIDIATIQALNRRAALEKFAKDMKGTATAAEIGLRIVFDPLDNAMSVVEFVDEPSLVGAAAVLPFVTGGLKRADGLRHADDLKRADDVREIRGVRHVDDAVAVSRQAAKAADEFVALGVDLQKGFPTFYDFKRVHGAAGRKHAWHHIVEQSRNADRFPPEALHNPANLVKLPSGKGSIHARVSGYYSSKPKWAEGKTVREWISERSFSEQYQFGIDTIKQFGGTEYLPAHLR